MLARSLDWGIVAPVIFSVIAFSGSPGGEGGGHDQEDHTGAHFAGWAEQGFHDSRRVQAELERRFVEHHFEWVPYLYPDLDEATSETDERAAIDAGAINVTGFRYVGVLGQEGDTSAGALRGR